MSGRLFRITLVLLLALAIAVTSLTLNVQAATLEEDIEDAVVAGLAYLAGQQNPDGSWGYGCDLVARTGLAVLKFETRAYELGFADPMDPTYEYADEVSLGLAYINANRWVQAIGVEPAGDPDSNGNGIGVFYAQAGCDHEIYNSGIAMMALAASSHPELYGADMQDAVDFMAWAQVDPDCDLNRGGWRYSPDECSSDNSNSGYATLGLGFAAAPPPLGFGIALPNWMLAELDIWLDVIQDDVDGDVDDGGSWYEPYWSWVNILKTGNLIYEFGLVGDTPDTARVQDAVDYVERHWADVGGGGTGWRDHRQAMFTMMKGLESMGIEFIDLDDDGVPEYEWFPEVAQHLLDTQNADGSWPWDPWGDPVLSTVWALLTLEKTVPVFEIPVAVDIKPGSCPNPLRTNDHGVVSVAIVGTEAFDVTAVNPVSVQLNGVLPLRWSYEDAAIPYEPYLEKPLDAFACVEYYPDEFGMFDGYADLVFKFDAQELVAYLGYVMDGEVLMLPLTGNLREELGGTPIVGEDVVRIILKNSK